MSWKTHICVLLTLSISIDGFKMPWSIHNPFGGSFSLFEQRFLARKSATQDVNNKKMMWPLTAEMEQFLLSTTRKSDENQDIGPALPLKVPIEVAFNPTIAIKDIAPFVAVGGMAALVTAITANTLPAAVILSTEALFYAFCMIVASFKFSTPVSQTEHSIDRDVEVLWQNILTSVDDPRVFFSEWFFGIDFDRIRREDAYEFLCWAIYSTIPERLSAHQSKRVDLILERIERETTPKSLYNNINFAMVAPGDIATRRFPVRGKHEEPLESMRHSIEPLRWVHKPFVLYFVLQFLIGTVNVQTTMRRKGYEPRTAGKLKYWASKSQNAKPLPIIFFHGIGGLFAYTPLIDGMKALGCTVFAVEMPYVSLHVAPQVPSIDEHVKGALLNST